MIFVYKRVTKRNGALVRFSDYFSGRLMHIVCAILAVIGGERQRHNVQMKIDWHEGYLRLA